MNEEQSHSIITPQLVSDIEQTLLDYPDGIAEYNLIKRLIDKGHFAFVGDSPWSPEDLFQLHFCVYHALYRLRDEKLSLSEADIEISALNIQLTPCPAVIPSLQVFDKLREYYLDIENLLNTRSEDIYELLARFWSGYSEVSNREKALSTLGLNDPVSDCDVKNRYRELAGIHHPDRGGDDRRFQEISCAANTLLSIK